METTCPNKWLSTSHGFRVYKYVLVGKHADDDDKSLLLKSHFKLIVLQSWPSFVTDFDAFHQTFFGHSFFNATSEGKAGLCYLLRLAEYEAPLLHPFLETQVILKGCFFLIQGINEFSRNEVERDRTDGIPFSKRYPVFPYRKLAPQKPEIWLVNCSWAKNTPKVQRMEPEKMIGTPRSEYPNIQGLIFRVKDVKLQGCFFK